MLGPIEICYQDLLRQYGIDVVLDLSVHETRAILEATDSLGISYVNTRDRQQEGRGLPGGGI